MRKHIPEKSLQHLIVAHKENKTKEMLYPELVKKVSQYFGIEEDKVSVFNNLYSTLTAIEYAYDLKGRKYYVYPTFENDVLGFIAEREHKFYDILDLEHINEKSVEIEENSVFIVGGYFGKSLKISNEFYEELRRKKVFIITLTEKYDFYESNFVKGDVMVYTFDNNTLTYTDDCVVVITNNMAVDMYCLATGGFARDGERLFIYHNNLPSVSSQVMFMSNLEHINEIRRFMTLVHDILKENLSEEVKINGRHLLVKSKKELDPKMFVNVKKIFSFYPNVKFPQKFTQILTNLYVAYLHYSFPYRYLGDLINILKGGEYENL